MYLSFECIISSIVFIVIVLCVPIGYYKNQSAYWFKKYWEEQEKNQKLYEKCSKLKQQIIDNKIEAIEEKYKKENL